MIELNRQFKAMYEKIIDAEAFRDVSGYTLDQVFDPEQRIDVWLTGAEAKKVGLLDEVVELAPSQRAQAQATMGAIAAAAGFNPKFESTKPPEKKVSKKVQMKTLEELRAAHPELYAAAVKRGATQEGERVKSWMAYDKVDPEAVKKGIESGEELTQSVRETFIVKMNTAQHKDDASQGSAGNVTPKDNGAAPQMTEEQKKEAEAVAKFEAEVEAENKKFWESNN